MRLEILFLQKIRAVEFQIFYFKRALKVGVSIPNLYIQVLHFKRVLLNVVAPLLNIFAHEN